MKNSDTPCDGAVGELTGLKYLVVGCGFYGAVMAERIASVLNQPVLVIDLRNHIGGNSYSYTDSESRIEVHRYGSHIFHTSNATVWEYVTVFEPFNTYQHKVYTTYDGAVFPMPINLHTINQFYRKNFSPTEAKRYIDSVIAASHNPNPHNLEEKAISLIGKDLYDAFIKGYTKKQWGKDPRELPPNIITRLPVRFNYNNRYFSDKWEGQPVGGYGQLFNNILNHPNIFLKLGVDFFDLRDFVPADCKVIYTGPIDRYFDYKYGVLGWRNSVFKWRTLDVDDFQGTSVMNYADLDVPYTRIHEFKHFHPERMYAANKTIVCEEFSREALKNDDPYYPINTQTDRDIYAAYRKEADECPNVIFGGRLGNYVYIDMHQAIAMALNEFERMKETI